MATLCDGNVWLALTLSTHRHHATAARWLDGVEGPGSVWFCRATQQTLLRLLTNATVLGAYGNPPLTNAQAWRAYDAFLADDRIELRDEPDDVSSRWRAWSERDSASPKLWMDAYLAAFAHAAGSKLVTTDAAFRQFEALDVLVLSA